MADIAVTAGNVVPGTDASFGRGTAGATITAGQWLYLDSTTDTLKLSDTNLSTAASVIVGVAVGGGAAGQKITYQKAGLITIGGTVASGIIYIASGTPGGFAPSADGSGLTQSIVGVGYSTTQIRINIFNSGSAQA